MEYYLNERKLLFAMYKVHDLELKIVNYWIIEELLLSNIVILNLFAFNLL